MSFLKHGDLVWLTEALEPWLLGARIQKVRRKDDFCLVLQCHRPAKPFDLIASVQPETARLSVSADRRKTVSAQDTVATWLKSNLVGHRIAGITCHPQQRILFLQTPNGKVVLELFGQQPRLICLDQAGRVRCTSSGRLRIGLRMGEPYKVPSFLQSGSQVEHPKFQSIESMERAALDMENLLVSARVDQRRRSMLRRGRKQLSRLKAKLLRDQEGLGVTEHWRVMGELLKAEVWRLKRGMEKIEVVNYFDSDMSSIEIELDPRLSGPENVERFFKRYRRGRQGHDKIAQRLDDVSHRIELLNQLETKDLLPELLSIELGKIGVKQPQSVSKQSSGRQSKRKPYHEFFSVKDERILVGRGGTDNHETTFRVAKGNDLWLHVKDAPGAHVIVPIKKGKAPHQETLTDAVALAIHYSKLRGEPNVMVSLTQRKYVRPVPNGPAGRVTIQSEKTRQVQDMDARLRRLFERRNTLR